jgi:hypothetical protein
MPSPIVWNLRISPPIIRNSHIEVGRMGKVVLNQLRPIAKKAHRNYKSRRQIRDSNDGAKRWIDEVLRDGVPKTDKLMPTHPRDRLRHAVTSKRLNRFFLQILKITNFPP